MKAKDLIYLSEAYNYLVSSANHKNKHFWPRYFTFSKLGTVNFNKDLGTTSYIQKIGYC